MSLRYMLIINHIDDVVGATGFTDPGHIVHHSVVYPFCSGLFIQRIAVVCEDGVKEDLIQDGDYTIFSR